MGSERAAAGTPALPSQRTGARALARKTGAIPLVLAAAATVGWAATSERSRAWALPTTVPLSAAGTAVLEVYAYYLEAAADFNRLEPAHVPDLDALPMSVAAARQGARQAAFELPNGARSVMQQTAPMMSDLLPPFSCTRRR